MVDTQGRSIEYLRISVTDRCNLRCIYCMPPQGVTPLSHEDILTYEELLRICRCAVSLGINRFKLTGGEPLVRRGISHLIESITALEGVQEVTMTTNGILLGEQAEALAKSGLSGVNISLDTLDPEEFHRITRGGALSQVTASIDQALNAGLRVKLNCVPLRTRGMNALGEVTLLAKSRPLHVRFIELMPIGEGDPSQGIPAGEVLSYLRQRFGTLSPWEGNLGNGPASYYTLSDFQGKIGVISAVSNHFCGNCNRVRLTAAGFLKLCLQDDRGLDLRALLRCGADDAFITRTMEKTILKKPVGHRFGSKNLSHVDHRSMVQIGG